MSIVDYLARMPPQEFEKFVATELLPRLGFKDIKWVGGPSDRGADALAKLEEIDGIHSYAIQVKRYTKNKVGEQTVRDLYTTMQLYNCDRGIIITTSDFTADAIEVAKKLNIRLINGVQLARLIQQYNVPIRLVAPPEEEQVEEREAELLEETVAEGFYSRFEPEDALERAKESVAEFKGARLKEAVAVMRRVYVYNVKVAYHEWGSNRRRTKTLQVAVDDEGRDLSHVLDYLSLKKVKATNVSYVRGRADAALLANSVNYAVRPKVPGPILEVNKELKKATWYLEEYRVTFEVGLTEVVVSVTDNGVSREVKPIDENALRGVALKEIRKVTEPRGAIAVQRMGLNYFVTYQDEDYVVQLTYDAVGSLVNKAVAITQSRAVRLALSRVNGEVVKVLPGYTVFVDGDRLYSCRVDQYTQQVSCSAIGVPRAEAVKLAEDTFTREMLARPTRWVTELKDGWEVTVEGITGKAVVLISLDGRVLNVRKEVNENYAKLVASQKGLRVTSVSRAGGYIACEATDGSYNYLLLFSQDGRLVEEHKGRQGVLGLWKLLARFKGLKGGA